MIGKRCQKTPGYNNRFETSHSSNQNHNLSWVLWMDSAGFDVCARLPFGKAHSIMERIFGWTITMATNTPFRQDCYPKKKETTMSMMDVRPITILSLLYRVLSKTWTKKLLTKIASFAPWPIRGS